MRCRPGPLVLAVALMALHAAPSAYAAPTRVAIATEHRELVARLQAEQGTLRERPDLAKVAASQRTVRREIEAFARTLEDLSPDQLNAIFLELQANDPRTAPALHAKLRKQAQQLKAVALAMAEAEAKQSADAKDEAEAAAAAAEELVEQALAVLEAILRLLGL